MDIKGLVESARASFVTSSIPVSERELEVIFRNVTFTHSSNLSRRLQTPTSRKCIDRYNGKVRIRDCDGVMTYIIKEKTKWDGRGFTLALSHEKKVGKTLPSGTEYREKTQRIHKFSEFSTLEISSVRSASGSTTEVELEFDSQMLSDDPSLFSLIPSQIEKVLQGLQVLDAPSRRAASGFNQILGTKPNHGNALAHKFIMQARNLKYSDMVVGGILPNRSRKKVNMRDEMARNAHEAQNMSYVVSLKADGVRKFLYFASDGLWMMSPPSGVEKIMDPPSDKALIGEDSHLEIFSELSGTVIEVEMIPRENRVDGDYPRSDKDYMFLAYDCLVYRGEDHRKDKYVNRHTNLNEITEVFKLLEPDAIEIRSKAIRPFETATGVGGFFHQCSELLDSHPPYLTDGLIFTPNGSYMHINETMYSLKDRVTTRVRDVLKWKPPQHLTIDFLLRRDEHGFVTLLNNEMGKEVEFQGSNIAPFSVEMIGDVSSFASGSIVEFGFVEGKLSPVRLRDDKTYPNTLEIALQVWGDIHDPIGENVVRGKTFTLVRKMHNRVKFDLFKTISNQSKKSLLDIGTGRGGDSSKWSSFNKIVAVEPSEENLIILRQRLQTTLSGSIDEKVRAIQTVGQDHTKITQTVSEFVGEKVDVVTLMLSLSFFYRSDEDLESLAKTIVDNIKPGGEILIMTVDGFKLQELMNPAFGGEKRQEIRWSGASIRLDGNEVSFNMDDSIAEKQTEWLVDIDKLLTLLRRHSSLHVETFPAVNMGFMTGDEEEYSKIYSALKITMTDTSGTVSIGGLNLPQTGRPSIPQSQAAAKSQSPVMSKSLERDLALIEQLENTSLQAPAQPEPEAWTLPPPRTGFEPESYTLSRKLGYKVKPIVGMMPDNERTLLGHLYVNGEDYKVYRIGCIGDGSCFFHAWLKSFHSEYQRMGSAERVAFVRKLRKEMSQMISDDIGGGETLYDRIAESSGVADRNRDVEFAMKKIQELRADLAADPSNSAQINEEIRQYSAALDSGFTLQQMVSLLDSSTSVGPEMIHVIKVLFGPDVSLIKLDPSGEVSQNVRAIDEDKNVTIICHVPGHFEVVALEQNGALETMFEYNHPLVTELAKFRGTG